MEVNKVKNSNLSKAKKEKNDEFYTKLTDIENELYHYWPHFKGKTIYCNCDDAKASKFFFYFSRQFEHLGLKKLITTSYNENGHGSVLIYEGDKNGNRIVEDSEIEVRELKGNGDFRSPECIEFLKEADIVVTNPPFSEIRDFIAQLMEYNKQFLFIGPMNIITYKEVFPLIKENKMWLGYTNPKEFIVNKITNKNCYTNENGQIMAKFGNIKWFTNLDIKKRHEDIILWKKYTPEEYPKYDNYDAINVDKVSQIPMDYDGIMGVPITFIDQYNPSQFKIIDALNRYAILDFANKNTWIKEHKSHACNINGKATYFRILIQKIKVSE